MDVRQLELFLAVVEEQTFTQAARRSFVSQSGLSSSIRALERELGATLFARSASGATLTAAGEAFLPRARRMLADATAAKRELMGLGSSRSLRLGSEQCLGDLVNLADVLTAFAPQQEGIEVFFQQAPSDSLLRDLRSGRLDAALIAGPPGESGVRLIQDLEVTVLRQEPFVLLVPRSHPLASESSVALAALRPERLVDFAPSWPARSILDQALSEAGVSRRATVEVTDVHMLLSLVEYGFGVAVVPQSFSAKPEAASLVALPLTGTRPCWETALALSPQAGTAARAFASMFLVDVPGRCC
ncbi:LysR family transcriptional regulator [Actinomyces lilanjuaniae]|uniref:LysR family transcriptional regulator n=1 Tax=Actinomyces lilanjuaniae TaxID=2321394 RepID=A0ABM6Z3B1_9ACTO|nr:LysR family transcriptional regulator [Actinomyces lilanjuaniae]AYD89821.1 LysR family transcriptional regulator [Actinomyces lilanjuaniae]